MTTPSLPTLGHLFQEPEPVYFTSGYHGSSIAKAALASPRKAKDMLDNVYTVSSGGFAKGTAWDRMLCGDAEAYHVQKLDGRTKEGKAWRASLPDDAVVLSQSDAEDVKRMLARAPAKLLQMAQRAEKQLVSRADVYGVPSQARYDAVTADGQIWDFKTTSSPLSMFPQQAIKYGYHVQLGWYRMVWEAASGEPAPEFRFLVSETICPWRTVLFVPSQDFIDYGTQQAMEAHAIIKRCLENNDWADTFPISTLLNLPRWVNCEQDNNDMPDWH